jgi:predicted nucleotidyltransferase
MVLSPAHRETWLRSWDLEAEALAKRRRELQEAACMAGTELTQRWPDLGIWMFGSTLGEGFRLDSDLDLAVEGLANGELLTALALVEQRLDTELRRLGIAPIAIDLVRIESLPPPWQDRIRRLGQGLG